MDKLAKQLRDDADAIEVAITPELDARIRASLHGTAQDRAARERSRPASFWWASSLTGIGAAAAVVLVINLTEPQREPGITEPPLADFSIPRFEWRPKPAILTETLEQELVDLQADLKKAEQAVRDDLDDLGVRALTDKGL